ncbi:TetR family transcriptional regulator [Microbacterium amylolyticum]|nr:TetR family transcriptional regulator [Microbacterium amylolyticum]
MRGAGHDLESIIDQAIALLDDIGLPDLSMRRLAGALGVAPSALYWHVANKQTLLAALADRIVAEAAPADGVDTTALALRDAILAHRDAAEVVTSSAALGLSSGAIRERFHAAYTRAGSSDPARAAAVAEQFLLGHTSLVQQRIQAATIGAYDANPRDVDTSTRAEFADGIAALSML